MNRRTERSNRITWEVYLSIRNDQCFSSIFCFRVFSNGMNKEIIALHVCKPVWKSFGLERTESLCIFPKTSHKLLCSGDFEKLLGRTSVTESVYSKIGCFPLSTLLRKDSTVARYPRIRLIFYRQPFFQNTCEFLTLTPTSTIAFKLFFKRIMYGVNLCWGSWYGISDFEQPIDL